MTFQVDIKDDQEWKEEIQESTNGITQVIECYQNWCGPCKAITSTFKKLYFDLGDRPLKFYTANVDKIENLSNYKGNCEPIFLFIKDGKIIEEIKGVQAPALTRTIISLTNEIKT